MRTRRLGGRRESGTDIAAAPYPPSPIAGLGKGIERTLAGGSVDVYDIELPEDE